MKKIINSSLGFLGGLLFDFLKGGITFQIILVLFITQIVMVIFGFNKEELYFVYRIYFVILALIMLLSYFLYLFLTTLSMKKLLSLLDNNGKLFLEKLTLDELKELLILADSYKKSSFLKKKKIQHEIQSKFSYKLGLTLF